MRRVGHTIILDIKVFCGHAGGGIAAARAFALPQFPDSGATGRLNRRATHEQALPNSERD